MVWRFFVWPLRSNFEDWLVQVLVRSPKFQHSVRTLHRRVNGIKDPTEPMQRGEATRLPGDQGALVSFFRHWKNAVKDDIDVIRGRQQPPPRR
ncbi:hypothetical protein MKZ38_006674 [Zalerion maritima]|uniref:Uncharacterized protein n=1 Tax=Zalerion maritima TaxID=339359 RepID=A0AAD5RVH6_9PEZI|nr:hypothetical protein MKZ38_006674 [Zalerion maritima]